MNCAQSAVGKSAINPVGSITSSLDGRAVKLIRTCKPGSCFPWEVTSTRVLARKSTLIIGVNEIAVGTIQFIFQAPLHREVRYHLFPEKEPAESGGVIDSHERIRGPVRMGTVEKSGGTRLSPAATGTPLTRGTKQIQAILKILLSNFPRKAADPLLPNGLEGERNRLRFGFFRNIPGDFD